MSMKTLRAGAGLVVALILAAIAAPPAAGGDAEREVRAASVAAPRVVGPVDEVATGSLLDELSERIAEDLAAAQDRHAEAVAIIRAAEAERLALEAERAEEARQAEEIWRAEEARQAEEDRRAEEARRAEAARAAATAPAGSLEAIIRRHFGSATSAAIRIAQCESSMNPSARSATNDHGLFQINAVHRGQFEAVTGAPWSSVYDPELNTIYARHLYGQQGWAPWTCAR